MIIWKKKRETRTWMLRQEMKTWRKRENRLIEEKNNFKHSKKILIEKYLRLNSNLLASHLETVS